MLQRFLLVVGLLGSSTGVFSQTLVLTNEGRVPVKNHLHYWRDQTQTLTLANVQALRMLPVPGTESPNFGFDRAAYWFRMDVENESSEESWLLEIDYSPLDQVDFFAQDDSTGVWTQETAGDQFPITFHRHPVFAINIPQQHKRTFYLRVETTSSVQLPAMLWQQEAFTEASSTIQLVNGLFYGAMFIMTLYQLFLFFSIRDRVTLYYILTLVAMTNVVAFFQGYNFLYLHPNRPVFNDYFAIITGPLFIVLSTLLTRAFLKLRNFNRWLDNIMVVNATLDVLVGLCMIIFFRQISYKFHHYFILLHCLLALSSAGYCFSKGYRPARYYLLAWMSPLLAAAFFTMSNLGYVPGYLSTNYGGLMLGCVLQTLFIAYALGDRWTTLEKQNHEAKEQELKREQEEKERLEHEVRLRTDEIHQQNLQLEEVNNVKDKLFSVVSHDIRGPLNSLHLALTLAKSGVLNSEEFQKISAGLEVRLVQTTEFIDNLLQWAKLQMKGETFEPDKQNLSDIAKETVRLLEAECRDKKITLNNNVQGELNAFADLNMIRSVFRNLLTNAIKFTRADGSVTLSAYRVDTKIILSVADTGVGIPAQNRDRLFTIGSITTQGTRQEKGTGLGLLLCKEFVEKHGGRIWFESEDGKGTTFYFSLPQYVENFEVAKANP
ncbi:sensor histidine kinase [Chryseolinea sp. Jin1]|uniref:histidine kinase n=2 Tax=Chryseolinea lacunae TaxID=2801331 RepID=A0ABS1KS21_9BACT|nr:sensor histidine kinase [Chryseolinea lacunae]